MSSSAAITNGQLANSSITLGSTSLVLGGTYSQVVDLTFLSSSVFQGTLSGTANSASSLVTPRNIFGYDFDGTVALSGVISPTYGGTGVNNGNNTITLGGNLTTSGNYNTILTTTGATNITLPASGILSTLSGTETLTNKTIESPILNGTPVAPTPSTGDNSQKIATTAFVSSSIANASIPDASASVKGILKLTNDLGGTADIPTVNQIGGVSSTTITSLNTVVSAATSSNTVNAIVKRDGSGNFYAATISAALNGNASTATALQTPRSIFGNSFDGTSAISGVISPTYGGTGVNNGNNTITLGGNLTTSGNFNTILTATAATNITLPTSGILATLSGTETLTNKTLSNATLSGTTSVNGALTISGSNVLTAGGTTFPTATGTTGQVLTLSSAGVAAWSSAGTTVREVFDETTVTGATTGTMSATLSLQTTFTLSQTPNSLSKLKMYINGILISFNAYSFRTDGTFATTTTTPTKWVVYNKTYNGSYDISANDRVAFLYFY